MKSPSRNLAPLFLILGLTAFGLVAGYLVRSWQSVSAAPQSAHVLPESKPLPRFSLLDQDGNEFSAEDFSGRWSLLFFGFTHCPDICPATLQIMSLARSKLADDGKQLPRLVLVSVDPDRDDPATLKKYTGHFGEDVIGLTGSVSELRKLASAFGIFFEVESPAPGTEAYNVAHSAHIIVLDDQGRYAAVFGAPHTVEAIAGDLPLLMAMR